MLFDLKECWALAIGKGKQTALHMTEGCCDVGCGGPKLRPERQTHLPKPREPRSDVDLATRPTDQIENGNWTAIVFTALRNVASFHSLFYTDLALILSFGSLSKNTKLQ